MRSDRISQIAIIFIVGMAFVDGILFANKLESKEAAVEAIEVAPLESVLEPMQPVAEEPVVIPEPLTPPFISQAPLWDWKEPWSDFAEEAVIAMVRHWLAETEPEYPRTTANELLAIAEEAGEKQLSLEKISLLLNAPQMDIQLDPTVQSLIQAFDTRAVVIIPVNGRVLQNPFYSKPEPLQHMVLVYGYDAETDRFLAQDPGTNRGEATEFEPEKLLKSIQDLDGAKRILIIRD